MNFTFTQDQFDFQEAIASMLKSEVTADSIRSRWSAEAGVDGAFLKQAHELGLNAMLVPEALGGLGLQTTDFILLAEACGEVALPEPLVESVMVSTPILVDILDQGLGNADVQRVIDAVLGGDARVAVGHSINPCINYADSADWFLLSEGDSLYLVPNDAITLDKKKSVDPSRRLFSISFKPDSQHLVADGDAGANLQRAMLNRGALATAAQLVGLSKGMIAQSVQYTSDREQFGKAIGANQAVKHLLADVAVQIEYAKPVTYRAAYTVGVSPTRADFAVSHAKSVAARTALMASRHCIQVHGAMGYTWECDVQIWAKRAWSLAREWGDEGFHNNRIHEWLLRKNALLGPEFTFGRGSLTDVA